MSTSRYQNASQWIYDAARRIDTSTLDTDCRQKSSHQDIVSQYDALVEAFLEEKILCIYPEDGIVGEELAHRTKGQYIWYIDPIDGTSNFVNQRKNFAISIACYHNNEPVFGLVYDVVANRLFHAEKNKGAYCNGELLTASVLRHDVTEVFLYTPWIQSLLMEPHRHSAGAKRLAHDVRGLRSLGSVALELCAVASGDADLFITMHSFPWDHNAARIILEEAHGALVTMENQVVPVGKPCAVVAASSKVLLTSIMQKYFMR